MGKSTISTGPFSSSQTVCLPEGSLEINQVPNFQNGFELGQVLGFTSKPH